MSYIIYFIITIGILVFVHEFGHFIAAKISGMRVDVFSIGFSKRLFGWNKLTGFTFGELPKDFDGQGNTDYRLCLLPLGGYVKIAGMVDESFDTAFINAAPQPYEFRSKPMLSKIFVISAGVLMNLLLAILVFWGMNFFQGKLVSKTTEIGYVVPNTLADSVGFEANDKVLAVNNKQVNNWEETLQEIFINSIGQDAKVSVERAGNKVDLTIPTNKLNNEEEAVWFYPKGIKTVLGEIVNNTPAQKAGLKDGDEIVTINGQKIMAREQAIEQFTANKEKEVSIILLRNKEEKEIKVTPDKDGKVGAYISTIFSGPSEYKTFGFFESIGMGWKETVKITELTFSMFGKVFSGKLEFKKAFGGPIKIAQAAAKSADTGLINFLYFLALLSLSLAIINIMPFPVLDGGHLIIILVEGLIKREIPIKIKMAIQNTGFVLLLLLMAFIIYNDIISL